MKLTVERIWNTIVTTLFYYSDNSTSLHLWSGFTFFCDKTMSKMSKKHVYMLSQNSQKRGNIYLLPLFSAPPPLVSSIVLVRFVFHHSTAVVIVDSFWAYPKPLSFKELFFLKQVQIRFIHKSIFSLRTLKYYLLSIQRTLKSFQNVK